MLHPILAPRALVGFLALAGALTLVAGAAVAAPASPNAHFLHRQSGHTLADLVQAELAGARKSGAGVVLMFTADWCSPCKVIKQFASASAALRKTLQKGRLLYIDVDEWRGPAHQLLPGVDPTKLPTLVNIDYAMKPVRQCYGTDLGLLSEDAVAHNLDRLLHGLAPEKAHYADNPELERKLILQQSDAQDARTRGVPTLAVETTGTDKGGRRVRLVIRNHEAPRRWYLVPTRLDQALSDKPKVTGWQQVRWTEHVRADFLRFWGAPEFVAVPVAGYGAVELHDWPLPGKAPGGKLAVWELDRLAVAGNEQTFQMKLPYELKILRPELISVQSQGGAAAVTMTVKARHVVPAPR